MTRRQRRAFIQDARDRRRARHEPLPGSAAYMGQLAKGINAAVAKLPPLLEEIHVDSIDDDEIREALAQAQAVDDEHTVLCCRAALGERNVPGIEPEFEHPVDARDEVVRIIFARRTS